MKSSAFLALIGFLFSLTPARCEESAPSAGENARTPVPRASAGEREMKALARSYPDRVAEIGLRNGDWAVRLDDTWYCWAEGRLLPETLRSRWPEYAGTHFYPYPRRLPPVPVLDEKARRELKERLEREERNPPVRHEGLLQQLYRAGDKEQTLAGIVAVRFLERRVEVHRRIVEPLAAVEKELLRLRKTKPAVREFLAGLKDVAGFSWRPVSGTRSRSYHSYGIAVDLMPESFGRQVTYWRWVLPYSDRWYAAPYSQRWMVPEPVVEAFERHGFVWGGKWFFYDTMHFEYSPENLRLAH